jgi:hypothetical protein
LYQLSKDAGFMHEQASIDTFETIQ